jgi:3-deoxy-manno-octulosonate cytidylyltransferase (CMP-KDO synthetase)
MVEHVYRRAASARGVDAVVVATDDERIASVVTGFGGIARMTSASHRTGTDRIAEIARDLACDVIVNVQGDEPLVEPGMIEEVVAALTADAGTPMSTLRRRIDDAAEYRNPNVVKVVVDENDRALYFSRSPIPHEPAKAGPHARDVEAGIRTRDVEAGFSRLSFKHVGLYAYRRDFLLTLTTLPQTPLEIAESLEQLRALEHGFCIRAVETLHDSIGVDTPEDLDRVRRQMETPGPRLEDDGTRRGTGLRT